MARFRGNTVHATLVMQHQGSRKHFLSCTVKVSAHAYIYPDMFKFCPDIGLHKTIMNIGNHTAVNVEAMLS